MNATATVSTAKTLSATEQAALINLLADDDPGVYRLIRKKILSFGPEAGEWLRPHRLSGDPVLRRHTLDIISYFGRQRADDDFLAFCLRHGEDFDVERGAWLLARTAWPDINVEAYTALLDNQASELRDRIDLTAGARDIFAAMNQYLFRELGFAGNEKNYYDPENSYLNRVIDRRTGNPISLSLYYMLLARRLRLPITGIGMPGHFICRYQSTADELYVDAFNRGQLLTKADCIQFLQRGNYSLSEDFLAPISARRMFLRICSNLHQIYTELGLAEETTHFQRYLIALAR